MKRLIIVATLIMAAAAGGVVMAAVSASAGISFGGYAQTAQHALYKAGHPYGYRVRCRAVDINYGTASFTVRCRMTEAG